MRLRWDELEQEFTSSDWWALSAPDYVTPVAAANKSAVLRQLDGDFEWSRDINTLSPASTSLSSSTTSFSLSPDGTTAPPVSAPAADVVRKWNFDGFSRDDLVFRAANLRDVIVLATNGTRYTLAAPTGYRLIGAADFSGDGIADLLFGSVTTGDEFLVKVVTNTAGVPTIPGTGDFNFNSGIFGRVILGIGDFDGNGRADFLRRDVDDGTGAVFVNFSTGTSFGGASTILSPLSLSWSLAGIGDINGDGRDDLIWRNVDNTVSAWIMGANGIAFTSVGLAPVGHEWKLEAVTRLNSADQLNDLVWRNVVSGRTIGWLMSETGGASISSVVELGSFAFDLEYVGSTYGPTPTSGTPSGGAGPNLLWRRTDGTTLASSLQPGGALNSDTLLVYPNATETHFRAKVPEAFDCGARAMWGPHDVLEPMRTRNFGGMGASGGNTGRIPLIQAEGGFTVLFAAGGGLAQFTPQAAAGGDFTLSRNWVLVGMGDFDSDGVGIDLLYRDALAIGNIGGTVVRWNTTTSRYEAGVGVSMGGIVSADSHIIGFGQIDTANTGDEIVWQNRDGLVGVSRVQTSGGNIFNTATTTTRIQSRDWVAQGVIDLDGNGVGDIVWRNAKTGSISYWSMNAASIKTVNEVFINTTPVTLEWDLVGMGDLDGDGDGDLIWRRNTDGFLATWLF